MNQVSASCRIDRGRRRRGGAARCVSALALALAAFLAAPSFATLVTDTRPVGADMPKASDATFGDSLAAIASRIPPDRLDLRLGTLDRMHSTVDENVRKAWGSARDNRGAQVVETECLDDDPGDCLEVRRRHDMAATSLPLGFAFTNSIEIFGGCDHDDLRDGCRLVSRSTWLGSATVTDEYSVPEPSSLLIMIAPLAFIGMYRRP